MRLAPTGRASASVPAERTAPRPRNFLSAPGYHNVDMAVFRNFRFEQRYNLQARMEATNISNLISLNGPNSTLTSKLFGPITSAAGARELQLGLPLTF